MILVKSTLMMASQEHIELSDYIKSVHENLRRDAETLGVENAWKKHCNNENNLRKYAQAMYDLANNHWEKTYIGEQCKKSRVNWVYNECQNYYFNGPFHIQREKEAEICRKIDLDIPHSLENPKPALKLLDVGSCYNPFKVFPCFDVLAIDIAPATEDVIKCDFLNLNIVSELNAKTTNVINTLQGNSFHIIVFSLFLEYLPSPSQRLLCCEKAYKLLKPEGVLIIITPDSKHVGANAKYMKSWRLLLARLGFSRIRYEKLPHIHCMMFRKSIDMHVTLRWADLHANDGLMDEFFIPQDFKDVNDKVANTYIESHSDSPYIDIENELPFYIDE